MAILATSGIPGKNGPEGRLGPPESTEKPETAGKAGKGAIWPFLRGTRGLAKVTIL